VVLVDLNTRRRCSRTRSRCVWVDLIATEARRQQVATFGRFALMQGCTKASAFPFEAFSIADGLHMNDWGYDCFARNLAAAIVRSAAPVLQWASASYRQTDFSSDTALH